MASNVFGLFGVKQFKPTAPDKGSFPLDHEGECKVAYLKYIVCLSENAHKNSECREHLGPLSSVTSPEFTGIQSPGPQWPSSPSTAPTWPVLSAPTLWLRCEDLKLTLVNCPVKVIISQAAS